MVKIRRPIIIIGIERSGKSLLSGILANHPDIYWLSNLDSRWPTGTVPITLIRLMYSLRKTDRIYMTCPGATSTTSGGMIYPSECLSYWRRVFRWGNEENYLIEDDCFEAKDLTSELNSRLNNDLSLRISLSAKKRLMAEQAGFSLKILFFNALFPDAIFLQTIRDPFENHDSLLRRKSISNQRLWGIKTPGWRKLLEEDLCKQAAIQLKSTLEIIDRDIVKIPDFESRFMRIRYEDLVAMPEEMVQRVLDFCDLEMTPQVLAGLAGVKKQTDNAHGMSYPKSEATSEILFSLARKYGYLTS